MAKFPLETRYTTRVSTKINKRKRPSDRTVFSEIARPAGRAFLFLFSLIFPRGRSGKSKRIPRSAERGQPARLDRAGSQTRTRLSPAGGNGSGGLEASQSDADFTGAQNGLCAILIDNHQIALIGQIHTGCRILSLWRTDPDTFMQAIHTRYACDVCKFGVSPTLASTDKDIIDPLDFRTDAV